MSDQEEKKLRSAPQDSTLEEYLSDPFHKAAYAANLTLQAMGAPPMMRSNFLRAFEAVYDSAQEVEMAQYHRDIKQVAAEGPPNPDQPAPAIMGPNGQAYQKRSMPWKPGDN